MELFTRDGYAVYKIYDSNPEEAEAKLKRSACLVHIRRYFDEALTDAYDLTLWFIEVISKMFTIEYESRKAGKTGVVLLIERLKPCKTADIMTRIEAKLLEHRDAGYKSLREKMAKAVKYTWSE